MLDLAIFHAAYPSLNFRALTISTFLGLLNRIPQATAYTTFNVSEETANKEATQKTNDQILIKMRFKSILPPDPFECE